MNNTWCNIFLGLIAALIGLLSFVDQFELNEKFIFLKSVGFKITSFGILSILGILITIRKDYISDKSSEKDAENYIQQIDSLKIMVNNKNEIIDTLNAKADTLLELTKKKDLEIEELQRQSDKLVDKVNVINSVEVRIELDIPENNPNDGYGKSIGINSALALFDDDLRLRFITDGSWETSKLANGYKKISLSYRPESPEQIVGKELLFLTNFNVLVLDYSEFLSMTDNTLNTGYGVVITSILINNKEIYNDKSSVNAKDFNGQLSGKIDLSKAKKMLLTK